MEWAFGHGLSYSKFDYSPLQLSSDSIDESSSITVTTQVTNHGPYDSKHSVLLFMFDMYRRVTPEYKLLKRYGLSRIFIISCGCHDSIDGLTTTLIIDLHTPYLAHCSYRFSKVDLKVGETVTVSWTLTSKDLEYVGIDSRYGTAAIETRTMLCRCIFDILCCCIFFI